MEVALTAAVTRSTAGVTIGRDGESHRPIGADSIFSPRSIVVAVGALLLLLLLARITL